MPKKKAGGAVPVHPMDYLLAHAWKDGKPSWTRLTLETARTLPRNALMYTDNAKSPYKNTLCR